MQNAKCKIQVEAKTAVQTINSVIARRRPKGRRRGNLREVPVRINCHEIATG